MEFELYRFPCPACHHTLKVRVDFAGRHGVCPKCKAPIKFPKNALANGAATVAQEIAHLVSENGGALDDAIADQAGMLLAQGTCMEYKMARDAIGGGPLAVRQWRRLLQSAGSREMLRLQLVSKINRSSDSTDGDDLFNPTASDSLLPTTPQADLENTLAWQIFTRYHDFLIHGTCSNCQKNPTGMECIYQNFQGFTEARQFAARQATQWRRACRHAFGLPIPYTNPVPVKYERPRP